MVATLRDTVKPVLVATSIKQATCKQANTLKCTCIKQASVLSKHFDCPLGACLIQVGLYMAISVVFFFFKFCDCFLFIFVHDGYLKKKERERDFT